MKRVLVTGADGFIGSHLTELLVREGYQVRALALYNSFNDWGWLETIKDLKKVEIITGDIRDPFFCNEITKDIDIVFHLAPLSQYHSHTKHLKVTLKQTSQAH